MREQNSYLSTTQSMGMLSLGVCIWLWVKWRALVSNSYLPETRRWFSVRHSITYNSRPPLGILLSPFLGHWPHITPINTVTSAFTCSVCWFRTRMTHIDAYVEVFGSQWVEFNVAWLKTYSLSGKTVFFSHMPENNWMIV